MIHDDNIFMQKYKLQLLDLALKYPNDAELGKEIRLIAYGARNKKQSIPSQAEQEVRGANVHPDTYVFSDEYDSGFVGDVKSEIAKRVEDGTYPTGR